MTELFVLYQMGNSEDWTWFSPIAVFLSESALRIHARRKGIPLDQRIVSPSKENEVRLLEPQEFVMVKSAEGELPEVDLETAGQEEE